jgi:hypothetical protein
MAMFGNFLVILTLVTIFLIGVVMFFLFINKNDEFDGYDYPRTARIMYSVIMLFCFALPLYQFYVAYMDFILAQIFKDFLTVCLYFVFSIVIFISFGKIFTIVEKKYFLK